jgi:hypothetical protein
MATTMLLHVKIISAEAGDHIIVRVNSPVYPFTRSSWRKGSGRPLLSVGAVYASPHTASPPRQAASKWETADKIRAKQLTDCLAVALTVVISSADGRDITLETVSLAVESSFSVPSLWIWGFGGDLAIVTYLSDVHSRVMSGLICTSILRSASAPVLWCA